MTFEAMKQEWLVLIELAASQQQQQDLDEVRRWGSAFAEMRREVALHRQDWLGGPRTLLAAMRVHNLEVPLTAAVAWLLRPDGHHGLGQRFLEAFLERFGVAADLSEPVRIEVEESIGDTRADLVVRVAGSTLLVESKVHAGEQLEQLDRLAERWRDERPVLIFLTRTPREPVTAVSSKGQWQPWLWSDVAADIRACLRADLSPSSGVEEFLETLEAYHRTDGGPVSDAKTDFYFKHWRQIEEWAALRSDARRVLEEALRGITERASDALMPGPSVVADQLDSGAWPHISVFNQSWWERGCILKVSVAWNRSQLLNSAGESWPYVGIHVDTAQERAQQLREAIKAEAGDAVRQLGWNHRASYWPAYRYIEPRSNDIKPAEIATDCMTTLITGWNRLVPALEAAVARVADPTDSD